MVCWARPFVVTIKVQNPYHNIPRELIIINASLGAPKKCKKGALGQEIAARVDLIALFSQYLKILILWLTAKESIKSLLNQAIILTAGKLLKIFLRIVWYANSMDFRLHGDEKKTNGIRELAGIDSSMTFNIPGHFNNYKIGTCLKSSEK